MQLVNPSEPESVDSANVTNALISQAEQTLAAGVGEDDTRIAVPRCCALAQRVERRPAAQRVDAWIASQHTVVNKAVVETLIQLGERAIRCANARQGRREVIATLWVRPPAERLLGGSQALLSRSLNFSAD